jgi:hypothetical protein
LPQQNRSRLLWLLSQVLERQLKVASFVIEEDSNEFDGFDFDSHDTIMGTTV